MANLFYRRFSFGSSPKIDLNNNKEDDGDDDDDDNNNNKRQTYRIMEPTSAN
jgi:hypothetical protein